jgi:hypothetical protein
MKRVPDETLQSWVAAYVFAWNPTTQPLFATDVADDILKGHCVSVNFAEHGASRNDEPHPRLPKFLNSVCETE